MNDGNAVERGVGAVDAGKAMSQSSTHQRTGKQARFMSRYGPWAIVTGASDGIGRAFAYDLAAAGMNVVLVARRGEVLEQIASELRTRHRISTLVITVDLARADAVAMIGAATSDLDAGLLVAAAGFGTSGPLIDAPLAPELEMVDVNCRAVLELSHQFGRRFAERGRGGIVLLSSLVAFQGVPRTANYAATKAYVQSLAEGLRVELGPRGVDVLASAPGPISSGFASRARMTMGMTQTPADVAQASLAALGRRGTVRPGWLAKGLGASLMFLPRWGRVRVMGKVMAGMTTHGDA
ncbi:MAG: SDR family oxidoreductase [Gemmatimonadaceae bacterium]|nr:SDR family oxidoreductase [Gemmatimonadaceae bacterium]